MAIYTEAQFVAYELARTLKDKKHFGFYCRLSKRFHSDLLFRILSEVKQSKNWLKIKNRGAYFTRALFSFLELDTPQKKA
jgi:hypothetical protein